MKYSKDKLNIQHHYLKEFSKFLSQLKKLPRIDRIIPGTIGRKQGSSSHKKVSFSYFTQSGAKLLMKKGGTVQELFLIFKKSHREDLTTFLKDSLHSQK